MHIKPIICLFKLTFQKKYCVLKIKINLIVVLRAQLRAKLNDRKS